jgi:hypothetical protein
MHGPTMTTVGSRTSTTVTEFTEVISDGQNPTIAYIHPPKPTWRQKGETYIEKVRDAYDTLWDWMPAIAAAATLLWLINTFHR